MAYSPLVKEQAFWNWSDGLEDRANAASLKIKRFQTIAEWRKEYNWEKRYEKIYDAVIKQHEKKKIKEKGKQLEELDKQHKAIASHLQGKTIEIILGFEVPQKEKLLDDRTRSRLLSDLDRLATIADKVIGLERKLHGVVSEIKINIPTDMTLSVIGYDGKPVDLEAMKAQLRNQNPHEYYPEQNQPIHLT